MCWKIRPERAASRSEIRSLTPPHSILDLLLRGLFVLVAVAPSAARAQGRVAPGAADPPGSGTLRILDADGRPAAAFPLRHTEVHADIAAGIAQVGVEQEFENPYSKPIEAVYVFPLSHTAAIDELEMRIGERIVRGEIHTRQAARETYERARAQGRVAALLDQERPNIFTQHVANILPGHTIRVRIRYVDALEYHDGGFEMVIPTVVGPRYIPGQPLAANGLMPASVRPGDDAMPAAGEPGGDARHGPRDDTRREPDGSGWSPDTDRVPDASHITPPVAPPGHRAGHDIGITVDLEAGVPLQDVACPSHAVDIERPSPSRAAVRLRASDTIPNKDFVLRYRVAGEKPELALLAHREPAGGDDLGSVALLVQPEANVTAAEVRPKEMIFLLDCSGSMSGEPIARSKAAMRWAMQHLGPDDTFQIIRFSDDASGFAPAPIRASAANVQRGLAYVDVLQGEGGTEMLKGILAALRTAPDDERLRIVCLLTDGYIGNEGEILAAVRGTLGNARLFEFGIGSSVNRYLLDALATEGRGAVDYIPLDGDTRPLVERFYDRIARPTLTDLSVDWGGLDVQETQPEVLPDLFAGQTLVVAGRYRRPASGEVVVRGRRGRDPFERRLRVVLPEREPRNAALGTLWARRRIDTLSRRMVTGEDAALVQQATEVALSYHLMSQWTSFVAVDNQVVSSDGVPTLVPQPVEMPAGVRYEGVFGEMPAGVDSKGVQGMLGKPAALGAVFGARKASNSEILSLPVESVAQAIAMCCGPVRDVEPQPRGDRASEMPMGVPPPDNGSRPETVRVTGGKSSDVSHVTIDPDIAPVAVSPPVLAVRLEPPTKPIAAGDRFLLRITIRNNGREILEVPVTLAAEDLSLRAGPDGKEGILVPSTSPASQRTAPLPPGATRTYEVRLEPRRLGFSVAGRYFLEIVALGRIAVAPGTGRCTIVIR